MICPPWAPYPVQPVCGGAPSEGGRCDFVFSNRQGRLAARRPLL